MEEEPTLTAKSEVSRRGWRRIAAYFFAGLMFSLACSWASFNWDTFERAYTARFGEDPYLVQHGDEILSWFPWGACAVIIALRLIRGVRVSWSLFLVGTMIARVAVPVALVFDLYWEVYSEERAHSIDFDDELWRQDEGDDFWWPHRLCMVNDLLHSKRLQGLTQPEVVALLGPPHEKGYPGGAIDCDLHYHLGPERGWMRIDSEWLFIALGNDGRVKRTWLYRD